MYINVYVYINIYLHIYVCIHVYICRYIYMYVYAFTHMSTYVYQTFGYTMVGYVQSAHGVVGELRINSAGISDFADKRLTKVSTILQNPNTIYESIIP